MEYNNIPIFKPETMSFEGEKISVEQIVNKEVAIMDIKVSPSSFYEGDFAIVLVGESDGKPKFFNTSSKVLIAQITNLKQKHELPVRSTITKVKRYYTLK
jgi:hypothetical protein